jgi:8-oxo-dGTP diphosphatase
MSDSKMLRPQIGVGVLVWRGKQLLLGKRIMQDRENCWQFPGGHLEYGETVNECAAREVMQETGLRVKALRHLGFTDRPFITAGKPYISLLVSCDYDTGELKTLEPDKCECWQWFDYHRLPSPLFEPIVIFLGQNADLYQLHSSSHC